MRTDFESRNVLSAWRDDQYEKTGSFPVTTREVCKRLLTKEEILSLLKNKVMNIRYFGTEYFDPERVFVDYTKKLSLEAVDEFLEETAELYLKTTFEDGLPLFTTLDLTDPKQALCCLLRSKGSSLSEDLQFKDIPKSSVRRLRELGILYKNREVKGEWNWSDFLMNRLNRYIDEKEYQEGSENRLLALFGEDFFKEAENETND